MKKCFFGFLAVFFLILNIFPSIGVYADNDLVIVPTSIPQEIDLSGFTDDDVDDLSSLGLIYGILKNGSSIDFSQRPLGSINNPFSDFTSILIGSVTGIDSNIWDDGVDYALQNLATGGVILNALDHYITPVGSDALFNVFGALSSAYLNGLSLYSTPISNQPTNPDINYVDIINKITSLDLCNDLVPFREPISYFGSSCSLPSYDFSVYSSDMYKNSDVAGKQFQFLGLSNCYINLENGLYHLTLDSSRYGAISLNGNTYNIANNMIYTSLWTFTNYGLLSNASSGYSVDLTFNNLTECFNYLYRGYRHINIYVDGNLWGIAQDLSPNISIGGETYINDVTSSPIEFVLPDNSYLDLTQLKNIIISAIDNSEVLKFEDIEDCIVDINGNPVIVTYNVIRNDYSTQYLEQYPNMLLPNSVFNPNILNESPNNLDVPKKVVEETVGVLPREIVGVLAIGGILTIFACIIHRLLE